MKHRTSEVERRTFEVKLRAFEVKLRAFEVKLRAFEVKLRAFEVKHRAFEVERRDSIAGFSIAGFWVDYASLIHPTVSYGLLPTPHTPAPKLKA